MSPLAVVLALSAAFFVVFLVVSGAMFMYRSQSGTSEAHGGSAAIFGGGNDVGVIELSGVIMDSKKTIRRLQSFEDNKEIKAVVLRLNSPGGAVAPSQEIYEVVRKYKKPLVVSMGSLAASGAFYIACGAKKVFANPGTITGSIGVIMEFANLEKLYQWAKIERYSIKTGKYKDAGAEYRAMTPEERGLFQTMIDDVLLQFKTAVSTGRKLTMAQVTAIADGRVMSGSQAKTMKLVDELGTFDDAVEEAGKEAKIKGKPNVVYPARASHGILDMLLDDAKGGGRGSDDSQDSESQASGSLLSRLIRAVLDLSGRSGDSLPLGDTLMGIQPGVFWLWNG
jgi:protease IV